MAANRDTCLARKLHDLGIAHPAWTITYARQHGLQISLAASVLIQETAGGHNVFGHDPYLRPTRYLNWLKGRQVTRFRYLIYKRARKAGHGMQGVGPLQLTWYEFQDQADAKGGCWRPSINMDVGFGLLASKIKASGGDIHAGVAAYNGAGQAANDYANQVLARATRIHARLNDCG
jgi:hypothetical protein